MGRSGIRRANGSVYGNAIPKTHSIVVNFVKAMRDDEILRHEFSYIPPEVARYNDRFLGVKSGFSLLVLIYTMQAMMGYGDDIEVDGFSAISFESFKSLLSLDALTDITKTRKSTTKYNYPYIEEDTYFPCGYHLAALAYTQKWRTPENVQTIADALNHLNNIMRDDNVMQVKIKNKYYAPLWALNRPLRAFRVDLIDSILYRRILTEIAMLGVGESVGIIRDSVASVMEAIGNDGILKVRFDLPHNKRYSPKAIEYPTPYVDVRLEADYKRKYALECDLTFWAVQFLYLADRRETK